MVPVMLHKISKLNKFFASKSVSGAILFKAKMENYIALFLDAPN